MDWIKNFDLFLFDFDGLLVNTEEIHYQAYKNMLASRGLELKWDFPRYCQAAHYDSNGLRDQICHEFPDILALEPNWEVLYKEKQESVLKQIIDGKIHLMPGVEDLIHALIKENKRMVVVTHSPLILISMIKIQNPILNNIFHWITRENYSQPKPDPESYNMAIERFKFPSDRIIGFEDTPRGLQALMQTDALPCLICTAAYPEIPDLIKKGAKHFSSFDQINDLSFTQGSL